jgi:hypothetical protein
MKTKIWKILLVLGITILIFSCSNKNDWSRFGLNGKVKSFSEKYYHTEKKAGEWEIVDKDIFSQKFNFDKNGNYSEIEYYGKDGELSGKLVPKYEDGKVIEEIYFDKDGNIINKTKIEDIKSSDNKFETYDKNGERTKSGMVYRENDKAIKQIYTTYKDSNVEDEITVNFKYNKEGQLISQKQTNKQGKIIFFEKMIYLGNDSKGNWIKKINYDKDNTMDPKYLIIREYEYY